MDFSKILEEWENRGYRKERPDQEAKLPEDSPKLAATRAEKLRAPIEDELDLHGMTREEALEAVRLFVRESRLEGLRKVLVIHGKGLHSEQNKGVLKRAVTEMLQKLKGVEGFGEAERTAGGKGATWIWLSVLEK